MPFMRVKLVLLLLHIYCCITVDFIAAPVQWLIFLREWAIQGLGLQKMGTDCAGLPVEQNPHNRPDARALLRHTWIESHRHTLQSTWRDTRNARSGTGRFDTPHRNRIISCPDQGD